jgi:preprotein translocase subunit SecA
VVSRPRSWRAAEGASSDVLGSFAVRLRIAGLNAAASSRATRASFERGELERLDAAAKAAVAKLKAASLGTGERAAAAAAIAEMQRQAAAAPAPSADDAIEASAAQALANAKVSKDGRKPSGRRKRRKKDEDEAVADDE